MTRCIHCTRCVRFGEEIAGLRELGATGRGEHMKIGTYVKHAMSSELSGNVIDLCPVGALTSKPFRYQARAWEMTQHATIAPHDSVGSNLYVHVRRGQVMRAVPRENAEVNETWISDRDRYSCAGLNTDQRLLKPMVKDGSKWREAEWEEALLKAATGIRTVADANPEEFGTLITATATLEELYLAQKLTRGTGSHNIDHRLRTGDFRSPEADPVLPWLGQSISDLESIDAALLVGSNARKEQPLINHRLRKAARAGASVMALNPVAFESNFDLAASLVASPVQMVDELAGVARAAGAEHGLAANARVNDAHRRIADALKTADNATVLLGNLAVAHPDYTILRSLAAAVAAATGARLGIIPEAANSAGAWLAGAVPHRGVGGVPLANGSGRAFDDMVSESPKAMLLVNLEPERDVFNPSATMRALGASDFVVTLSAYRTRRWRRFPMCCCRWPPLPRHPVPL